VARRLDAKFASLPSSVPDAAKRTAVLFAGYTYDPTAGVEIFVRSVANYRRGGASTHAFRVDTFPDSERYNYISAVGAAHALAESDREELGKLINAAKPPQAVVGKAVEVVRTAARSSAAQDVIGGQLMSLVVPAPQSQPLVGAYHTESLSDTIFFPGSVTVDARGEGLAVMQPSFTSGALTEQQIRDNYQRGLSGLPRDTTQRFRPIAIPKVGRNRPCPCGSGQKYKRCHGR
jgi:SEC-C motif